MKRTIKRNLLVFNPVAGTADEGKLRAALADILPEQQFEFYQTKGENDTERIIERLQAGGFDRVITNGGDGTVSVVANAIYQTQPFPLGIIPGGTANVLAKELNIPIELRAAVNHLAKDVQQLTFLDGMQINDCLFFSHVSMGTYSRITEQTSTEAKKKYGVFAYLYRALLEFSKGKSWRYQLEVDGKKQRLCASLILVANIGSIGLGDLKWGKSIRPTDGTIDVCIVKSTRLQEYLDFFRAILNRNHRSSEQLEYIKAQKSIKIITKSTLPLRADGDLIGSETVEIKIVPRAVGVWV